MLCAMGCKTVSTQVRQPPANAAAYCQALPDTHKGMTLDDILRWAGITVERFNDCAIRHKALSDWATGQK